MQWMPSSSPPLQKKKITNVTSVMLQIKVDQWKTFLQATSQYYKYNVWIYMQDSLYMCSDSWQNSYSDNCCIVISLLVLSITFYQEHFIHASFFLVEYLHSICWLHSCFYGTYKLLFILLVIWTKTIQYTRWPLPTTSK